jgi:heme A synthase
MTEPLSNDALNAITDPRGRPVTFIARIHRPQVPPFAPHGYGVALLLLLLLQVALGVTNILASLPLPAAVAHNGVAALSLVTLVMLNFAVNSPTTFRR